MQESLSNLTHVHLRRVDWSTGGLYRCEVTSDEDYEMIYTEEEVEVIGELACVVVAAAVSFLSFFVVI